MYYLALQYIILSSFSNPSRQNYIYIYIYIFFDLRGVSGPAYAHHDYSPRPTGHPASSGAGKAPRG